MFVIPDSVFVADLLFAQPILDRLSRSKAENIFQAKKKHFKPRSLRNLGKL